MAAGAQSRSRVLRSFFPSIAAIVSVFAASSPSSAVVVEGRNAIVPRPSGGWVGAWNGSSAVPVGQYWIITARHVGGATGQPFIMRGQHYQAVEIRQHESQDLQLVRVNAPMPGWHEIAAQPSVGSQVLLGGCGATTLNPLPGGTGWDWNGAYSETWGRNAIVNAGTMLRIRFDPPGSQGSGPQEAAFAINDSGGGLFSTAPDGQLLLVGTAVSVSGPGSSAYGVSCYCVSLPMYREWIDGIVDTPTQPSITCNVLEFLSLWFAHDPTADIDHNMSVEMADLFAYFTRWSAEC